MKVTERSNFRVVATLRTVRASEFRENLDGWMIGDKVSITFMPRRAGDMDGMSIPEQWVTEDSEEYYLGECRELTRKLRGLPYVRVTEIVWDEKNLCSFCKLDWEELDQDFIDQHPQGVPAGHGVGTPVCCEQAQDEWIEENHPACIYETGGTYETPPERCDLDTEPGDEYCPLHRKHIDDLEALIRATEAAAATENSPR